VVDPAPGSGASTVAAGMLAPVTEARIGEEPLLRLNHASLLRWPAFAAELEAAAGRRIGFRTDGTLMVGLDADDRAALDDLASRHRAMGLEVEPLRGREARRLEPGLAPGVRAGLLAADERSVDPAAVVAALEVAAAAAGVALVRAPVARLVLSPAGDRATGVALGPPAPDGEGTGPGAPAAGDGRGLAAGTVLLAARGRSSWVPGLRVRERPRGQPVRGVVVTLREPPDAPLVSPMLRGIVLGSTLYRVPRDAGRIAVGATQEARGWDTRSTAGGTNELL